MVGGGGMSSRMPGPAGMHRGPFSGSLPDVEISKLWVYARISEENIATPLRAFTLGPNHGKILSFVLVYHEQHPNPAYELVYEGGSVSEACALIASVAKFSDPTLVKITGLYRQVFHPLFDDEYYPLTDTRKGSPLIFEHGDAENDPLWMMPVYRCTAIVRDSTEHLRRVQAEQQAQAYYNQQMSMRAAQRSASGLSALMGSYPASVAQTIAAKQQIANAALTQQADKLYTALLTSNPDDPPALVEVSGGGYARQEVPLVGEEGENVFERTAAWIKRKLSKKAP